MMRWYWKACGLLAFLACFTAWVAWRSDRYPAITEALATHVKVGMDLAEVERILGPARDETRGNASSIEFFPPNGSLPSRFWVANDLIVVVRFDPYTTRVAAVEHRKPDAPPSSFPQRTWNAIARSFGEDRTEPLIPQAEPTRIHTTITGGIIGPKRKGPKAEDNPLADLHPSPKEDPLYWEKAGLRPGLMGDGYPFHFLGIHEERARPGLLSFQATRSAPDFDALPRPPRAIGLDLSMIPDAEGGPNGNVTDQQLKALLKLKNIERLYFDATKVTAHGWKDLSGMRELRAFSVVGGTLDAAALQHLGSMQNLEKLFAIDVKIDHRELGCLKYLRRLELNTSDAISEEGLKHLASLPRLNELAVRIDQSKIDPAVLSKFKYLTKLNLSMSRINQEGFKEIATLKGLRSLDLSYFKGNEGDVRTVNTMENLEELTLAEVPIEDTTLQHLSALKSLRRINLSRTRITDRGIGYLQLFPNLIEVELIVPEFSKEALDALRKARPRLRFQEAKYLDGGV